MTLPKISIVIPSFNQARFLKDTLDSLISQKYPNLELLVLDGGSTDGSIDIIRQYSSHIQYWVSGPDGGQTNALISGFSKADGDILAWLNSDDLHEPWTLMEVADFFRAKPQAQVVYGDAVWIDVANRPIRPKKEHAFNRFIWMNDYNYIPQPSTFWRRELYQRVGGIDPRFQLAMDADLWIRFAEHTDIHHVRRVWSRMRLYPEQKNQRLRSISDLEDKIIRERYQAIGSVFATQPKALAAKALRVTWKLMTGCYW